MFTLNETWSDSRTVISRRGDPTTGTHGASTLLHGDNNSGFFTTEAFFRSPRILKTKITQQKLLPEPQTFPEERGRTFETPLNRWGWTSIHLPQASARLQTGLRMERGAQEEKLEEASGWHGSLRQRCEKGQKDQNFHSSTSLIYMFSRTGAETQATQITGIVLNQILGNESSLKCWWKKGLVISYMFVNVRSSIFQCWGF